MYENFYHLRAKPFRLSPDPGFYYASRGHKRALAYLRYGLAQGEGFVVITGAPGTGKTTLAQILLREMDTTDVVVAHLTTTQLEADDMLRMVAASFGLRYQGTDKAALLKLLENFLLARSREGKRALLVVDEAQNLPARSLEELRMLSNLQVGDHALLQTFLLGQYQFRQMLDHPDLEQLNQRVIANYHLSSLAADECKNYVESRLRHVGWDNDPVITDGVYEIIHRYTEGVPRRINMLCDRVMLFSCLEERHEIDEAVLKEVTDELQSEISGSPLPATGAPSHEPSQSAPDAEPEEREADGEESPERAHHEVADVIEELEARVSDMALNAGAQEDEKADDQAERPSQDTGTGRSAFAEDGDVAAVAGTETGGAGESSQLDRVSPDENWNRVVAEAAPDDIDDEDGSEAAGGTDRLADKDRFRVIVGGKESAAGDTPPSDPAVHAHEPAAQAPIPDTTGDTEEVVLRKILRLVLAFHRSPRSFPGLDDPSQPLPPGIQAILKLAVSEDEVLKGLRQISVMGISPAMLRAAVRFFVRRVMFAAGGDDYRVLGLQPGAGSADIEIHYGLLMRLLRQEKETDRESGVTRIGAAYERLCRADAGMPSGADLPPGPMADLDDIDEELDLDLAPPGEKAPGTAASTVKNPPLAVNDGPTAPTARNLVLLAGAIVVGLVLYLTQVGPGTERDTAGSPPVRESAPVAALAPEIETDPAAGAEAASSGETENNLPLEAGQSGNTAEATRPAAEAEGVVAEEAPAESPDGQPRSQPDETLVPEEPAVDTGPSAADIAEELAALKAAAEAELKAREEAEARMRAAAEEKARLEAQIAASLREQEATAKRLREEAEARAIAEAKLKAAAEAKAKAEAKAAAEARARAEAEARARAEAEALARAEAEKARIEAEKARVEAEAAAAAAAETVQTTGTPAAGLVASAAATGTGKIGETATTARITSKPDVTVNNISQAELSALMGDMIESYEDGDIEAFMALFAKDAQTNDRATVAGIRKDYQELFDNTLLRILELRDLDWRRDGRIMRGEGRYVVQVQATGRGKIDTYEGNLWIQVERRDGRPKITHFAFVE